MSTDVTVGSSETRETTRRLSSPDLVTVTPWFCTACGKRDIACCTLFCTCISATSEFVPAVKLSVTRARPLEVLFDDIDSRWSSPFICCSMTCVTESSTVFAEAPL